MKSPIIFLLVVFSNLAALHAQLPSFRSEVPLTPAPDSASYTLTSLKISEPKQKIIGQNRFSVAFRYVQNKPGNGDRIWLVFHDGKFRQEKFRLGGLPTDEPFKKDSSTLSFDVTINAPQNNDPEWKPDFGIWLEQESDFSPGGAGFQISNRLINGRPKIPAARGWTKEERAAYSFAFKMRTPPGPVPAGYVAVDHKTKLLPGMPVKAGHLAKWKDAILVETRADGQVGVRFSDKTVYLLNREKWIAVSPTVLERGKSDPASFSLPVDFDPDAIAFDDSQLEPVSLETKLVLGTPVRMSVDNNWHRVYIIKLFEDGKVRVDWPNGVFDETATRSRLRIDRVTLDQLQESGVEQRFIQNLREELREAANKPNRSPNENPPQQQNGTIATPNKQVASERTLKPYPIDIAIPDDADLVNPDTELEKGLGLAACWASKWNHVTLLEIHDDGSLRIHWNDFGSAYDCDMARSDLIIRKSDATRIARERIRTWSDSTGKFKVEAFFIKKTDSEIELRDADGKEINVPLQRLSQRDRDIAESFSKSK